MRVKCRDKKIMQSEKSRNVNRMSGSDDANRRGESLFLLNGEFWSVGLRNVVLLSLRLRGVNLIPFRILSLLFTYFAFSRRDEKISAMKSNQAHARHLRLAPASFSPLETCLTNLFVKVKPSYFRAGQKR